MSEWYCPYNLLSYLERANLGTSGSVVELLDDKGESPPVGVPDGIGPSELRLREYEKYILSRFHRNRFRNSKNKLVHVVCELIFLYEFEWELLHYCVYIRKYYAVILRASSLAAFRDRSSCMAVTVFESS